MTDSALLYATLAEELGERVLSGELRAGHKLPSVRRTSRERGVSPGTVVQAYRLLESRGLVAARPQSGFYVSTRPHAALEEPRVARPPNQLAVAVGPDAAVARIMAAALDPKVVPLGAAFKAPELTPETELSRALRRVSRSAGNQAYAYERTEGSLLLRQRLARRTHDFSVPLSPEDFVITIGASEALYLCLRAVTRPGDTIAVESPTYYGVLRTIESLGLKVVEIPVGAQGMDLDVLRAVLASQQVRAVLAVPTFNNPTGSLMPDARKVELVAELARRSIPLIEDDIYGDLPHDGERPLPAKAWDRQGLVLLVSSFSKTLAPGLRVGFVCGGKFHERILLLKLGVSVCGPRLPQLVVADLLESGAYDRFLRGLRAKLAAQVAELRALVARHFPEGTRVSRPQGGHLLWVELPAGTDATRLAERALEAGIGIVPGTLFSPRDRFEHFIRLNAGYPIDDRIAGAVRSVGRWASER
jgi:DNA-binding transcriptional MocR family regulator